MKGRPPKAAGNVQGHRNPDELEKRKESEPKVEFDEADFVPPPELDNVALDHWKEIVAIFKRFKGNAVNGADRRLLQIACETWSDIVYCNEKLKKDREPMVLITTAKDDMGNPTKQQLVKNPYWERREKARANYIAVCDRLQLSPTSRARIGKGRADNPDADDNFF
jgi:P27 family predicted phage terminase small subunit